MEGDGGYIKKLIIIIYDLNTVKYIINKINPSATQPELKGCILLFHYRSIF